MNIASIELKHNIIYPKIYKDLYTHNMLDWGKFGKNWLNNSYPELSKQPPFLLYANDFEWIDFERIDEEADAFKDADDYRQTNPKFNFIPFAQTGAGDLYCFQFDTKTDDDVPIIKVWHDMNYAITLAKNLQDFIFRSMLETLTDFDSDYSLLANGSIHQNLKNYYATHSVYLNDKQKKLVDTWYQVIIKEKRTDQNWFSTEEIEKITSAIKANIDFADLDKEFEYQAH